MEIPEVDDCAPCSHCGGVDVMWRDDFPYCAGCGNHVVSWGHAIRYDLRLQALWSYVQEVVRLRAQVEKLLDDGKMACEDPRPGCDCSGCRYAAERAGEGDGKNAEVDRGM